MKKFVTTIAFILTASTAMAADAVYEAPAAPVADVAPAFSWNGFNIGIQGGYGWYNQDVSGGGATDTADFDGGLLGGFVGYNYDLGNNWVVGLEADFEKSWADGSADLGGPDVEYGFDWQGSVRGRVGYAFDRALIYGTAGWAYGSGYLDIPAFSSEKETFNGYTVGVGLDYAFTDMMFGRVEYRYTDFGNKDFSLGGASVNSDVDQHAIRVGLGVKF